MHYEIYDEDDPTMVYKINKPRGEVRESSHIQGYKPEFKAKMFGAGGNFKVVNEASHYDYTKKGGKYVMKMVYEDRSLESLDGGPLTVSNFDALTESHSLGSVGTETLCAKSVQDYMSESHAAAFESKVAQRELEAKLLAEALEKQRLESAARKLEENKASLEALYVAKRWGRIPKTKVGPWDERPTDNQYTCEGTLLTAFKRAELDKAIASALVKHEQETEVQITSSSEKSKGDSASVSIDDASVVSDFSKRSKKKGPQIKIDPSITRFEDMRQKLGDDRIENITQEWMQYSDVVRKKAKKEKRFMDFSLDLFDACDRGQVGKVNAILATGKGDAKMVINEEPLFMLMFSKAILKDQLFSTYTDDIPEVGERKNMTGVLNALISFGADIDCLTASDGYAPIHHACITGNSKLLKWVLSKKGSIGLFSRNDRMSPLMLAAKYGHVDCLSILMGHPDGGPSYMNMVDGDPSSGKTALHYAANFGQTHACMFLLRIGADKIRTDKEGRHPGKLALDSGYFPTAQMILGFNSPPVDVKPVFAYLDPPVEETTLGAAAAALNSALSAGAKLLGAVADGAMSLFGSKSSSAGIQKKKDAMDDAFVSVKSAALQKTTDDVRPFDED